MRFANIKESLLLRMFTAAAGSAILTLTILVVTAVPASAYTLLGCQYDSGSIDPISYRFFSVNSAYETVFKDAEAAWDGTSAPGYFAEQSWSIDPEINVTDGAYMESWWASMYYGCDGDDTYSGNEVEIEFNINEMDSFDSDEKERVAQHELGHAYGLDHVSSGCHAMRSAEGMFCGTVPSSDDVAGVDAIY